ncbi:MAG: PPC domain-containing DNA-binding protein [Thermodesulfobacteriota bacterium]
MGTKMPHCEYKTGRRLLATLKRGDDLIGSVEQFSRAVSVETACFSVWGAVSAFTIGVYDQKQQVYVTHSETAPREILSCTGTVSFQEGAPAVHARIVLADEAGGLTGGRLFSETRIFAAELVLEELLGPPLKRGYDSDTGMMLWRPPGAQRA